MYSYLLGLRTSHPINKVLKNILQDMLTEEEYNVKHGTNTPAETHKDEVPPKDDKATVDSAVDGDVDDYREKGQPTLPCADADPHDIMFVEVNEDSKRKRRRSNPTGTVSDVSKKMLKKTVSDLTSQLNAAGEKTIANYKAKVGRLCNEIASLKTVKSSARATKKGGNDEVEKYEHMVDLMHVYLSKSIEAGMPANIPYLLALLGPFRSRHLIGL